MTAVLILAIEPNRTQAQQIASLVKQHVKKADVVTATSADAALVALGDRIPDLILIPALLAPRDEAVLTDHLRQLGSAAAHVQTLAVPIIASGRPRGRDSGGLLGRRRDKPASPDAVGCEPAMFAEQIKLYLDRAAREREASVEMTVSAPAAEPDVVVSAPAEEFDEIVWLADPSTDVSAEPMPETPPAPVVTPASPKAQARSDDPATRVFETEFGLPPSASGSPPLWRVTEEGIEALAPEPEPEPAAAPKADEPAALQPEPMTVIEELPPQRPTPVRASRAAPKWKKPTPAIDEWAYFDPQRSSFKALIRRLEEFAREAAGGR